MKTLKTPILIIILFFINTVCLSEPIMQLAEKAENYKQTETGYVINFDLSATAEELAQINNGVQNLSDRLTLSTTTISNNLYKCVMIVDHQNQPEYVYKMLLTIGIKGINYKNENFELIKIIEILKSYL